MGIRRLLALSTLLAFSLSVAACGEEGPLAADGGVDAAVDGALPTEGPVPPEAAILPSFGVCPDGWRSEPTGDGFDVCEPFPAGGRPACARDEAFFPGAAACEAIGTSCPVGDFPVDLPAGAAVLYVLAGAVGGDGTEASPFGTITEALAVAEAGAIVAVGKGQYVEPVTIPAGVSLVGACVAETVLTADGSSYTLGVVNAGGAGTAIRNLRIADSDRPGVMIVGEDRSLVVEDVVVHDVKAVGISVEEGAELTAERLGVRDIQSIESISALGRGINVETDAQATVRWLHVEGAKEFAVLVMRGGQLTLEDATLVDTRLPAPMAPTGSGLVAGDDGHLVARRVVVEEATMIGVLIQNEGSDATLTDVVVRRTRPGTLFGGARGIDTIQFASLNCTRCFVEDVLETGIGAIDEASVTLTDSYVRRVGPRTGDQRAGKGLLAQNGADLHVERVAVVDLREAGALVGGLGSSLTGGDLLILRVTGEASTGENGTGITIQSSGVADLARVEIGHATESGMFLAERGSANVADLFVHDVAGRPADGRFGRGVTVQLEGNVTVERARIERVLEFGLAALGPGAQLTATDVTVSGITSQDCSAEICSAEPGGHGVGSYFSAQVSVRRFGVETASLCGVQVAEEATLSLADGIVRGALIGACLQSDAQDVRDLQNDVQYIDNGSNLEATMLPVPAAIEAAE